MRNTQGLPLQLQDLIKALSIAKFFFKFDTFTRKGEKSNFVTKRPIKLTRLTRAVEIIQNSSERCLYRTCTIPSLLKLLLTRSHYEGVITLVYFNIVVLSPSEAKNSTYGIISSYVMNKNNIRKKKIFNHFSYSFFLRMCCFLNIYYRNLII